MCKAARVVVGPLLFAAIGGCTTLTVSNADVTVERFPGFAVLSVTPRPDTTAMIRTTAAGLSIGPGSATFGYLDETRFIVDGQAPCKVFVLVRHPDEAAAWVRAFEPGGAYAGVCVSRSERQGP